MNPAIRRTLVVFPLSLLFAGCHAAHRSEFHSAQEHATVRTVAAHPAPTIERSGSTREAGLARHPNELPAPSIAKASRYDITLTEFRGHMQNNTAVIIDAREPEDFAAGHIRGALNLPADQKVAYLGKISREVGTSQFIIIYCGGPQCNAGDKVYDYLATQGYSNMRIFKPGWQTLASSRDLH